MNPMHFIHAIPAFVLTATAFAGAAASAVPNTDKYLQEIKNSEGLPIELTVYIFNMEEKMLIESKAVDRICEIGKIFNSKGIPLFNIRSIQRYYDGLEKEDYSSFGKQAESMKIFASSIKLSAFIKTVVSRCPNVF